MKKYSIQNILLFSFIVIVLIVFIFGIRELLLIEELKKLKETSEKISKNEVIVKEIIKFIDAEKTILIGISGVESDKVFYSLISKHDVNLNSAKNNFKKISFINREIINNVKNTKGVNKLINDTRNEFFGKYISSYLKIIEKKDNEINIDNYYIEKKDTLSNFTKNDLKNRLTTSIFEITKNENERLTKIETQLIDISSRIKKISLFILTEIDNNHKKSQTSTFLFFGLILILLSAVLGFIFSYIIKPLFKIQEQLSIITEGELPERINLATGKEIHLIGNYINKTVTGLKRAVVFSNEIGKGNLNAKYKLLGENDELGTSLLNLQEDLLSAQKEEEKRQKEDKERYRTNEGVTLFNEIVRKQSDNLTDLSDDIISTLVKFTNSNQGTLFFLNDKDKEDIFFELLGAYAYNQKKYITKNIKVGEGLIGSVANEKYTLYMTDVPEEYIEIESGTGSANPRSILIVPLKVEDEVLGVIELASFNKFEEYEIKMVEKIAESIASTLATATINLSIKQRLENTQAYEKQIKEQEAEIQQNIDELKRLAQGRGEHDNLKAENDLLKIRLKRASKFKEDYEELKAENELLKIRFKRVLNKIEASQKLDAELAMAKVRLKRSAKDKETLESLMAENELLKVRLKRLSKKNDDNETVLAQTEMLKVRLKRSAKAKDNIDGLKAENELLKVRLKRESKAKDEIDALKAENELLKHRIKNKQKI